MILCLESIKRFYPWLVLIGMYLPIGAEGANKKIHQLNYELTFNGLICKGNQGYNYTDSALMG